jgi:hypothetical protein
MCTEGCEIAAELERNPKNEDVKENKRFPCPADLFQIFAE